MNVSLKKANEHRNAWFEGVQKCNLDETLYTIMERIVRAEVHRLVVVDENEKVIGIISLSDLLLYLVLRPSGDGLGDSESLRATDPAVMMKTSKSDSESLKIEENLENGDDSNAENLVVDAEEAVEDGEEGVEEGGEDGGDSTSVKNNNSSERLQLSDEEQQPDQKIDLLNNTNVQREVALVSE